MNSIKNDFFNPKYEKVLAINYQVQTANHVYYILKAF